MEQKPYGKRWYLGDQSRPLLFDVVEKLADAPGITMGPKGWSKPFNLLHGWILWGGGGLIIASSAVFLVKSLVSSSSAGQMQNQADSLVRLLPLIGASDTRSSMDKGRTQAFPVGHTEGWERGLVQKLREDPYTDPGCKSCPDILSSAEYPP